MRMAVPALLVTGLVVSGTACSAYTSGDSPNTLAEAPDVRAAGAATGGNQRHVPMGNGRHIVDIVAVGHRLEAPATIPSGWTTFRLHNRSDEVHFALIDRLPAGTTVADMRKSVVPVFQEAMDLIAAGQPDAGFARFSDLPAWYSDVVYMGGPGLVSPHRLAETTVRLEPGRYVIECYVKTNGEFHTTHGMLTEITVTEEDSGMPEPTSQVDVSLSSETGITVDGRLRPGRQTIAVHFEDQAVHGNLLGHDLHLARLNGTDSNEINDLSHWMSWVVGLEDPAPVDFLGGTHDMPAGHTAYLTVNLAPGQYAFVSEVDDPMDKDMLQTFTVPRATRSGLDEPL